MSNIDQCQDSQEECFDWKYKVKCKYWVEITWIQGVAISWLKGGVDYLLATGEWVRVWQQFCLHQPTSAPVRLIMVLWCLSVVSPAGQWTAQLSTIWQILIRGLTWGTIWYPLSNTVVSTGHRRWYPLVSVTRRIIMAAMTPRQTPEFHTQINLTYGWPIWLGPSSNLTSEQNDSSDIYNIVLSLKYIFSNVCSRDDNETWTNTSRLLGHLFDTQTCFVRSFLC